MLFNSLEFLFFIPIVLGTYLITPEKYKNFLLLGASYYFYGCFSVKYLALILFTTVVSYTTGLFIGNTEKEGSKQFWVAITVVSNLAILFIFKYFNFFNEIVADIARFLNFEFQPLALKLLLPAGISFYTFQAISYSIDVARGDKKAESSFIPFALFVSFFPQLVAGPIERSKDLLPQFFKERPVKYVDLRDGFLLALWGMFKKVVIADRLGIYVNEVYGDVTHYSGIVLITATFFFAFQVYTDFSGYSDIAIGLARMFGVSLSTNFNRPYLSTTVSEFWRKWHISLLTWFRDYLFNPIAIKRRNWGIYAVLYATFITFFLSGLWHGAALTYVVWGVLHAFALMYEVATFKTRKRWKKRIPPILYNLFSGLIVFVFVNFTYIFFRAASLADAWYVVKESLVIDFDFSKLNLFEFKVDFSLSIILIILLVSYEILEGYYDISKRILTSPSIVKIALVTSGIFLLILLGKWEENAFIYFQF